MWTLRIILIVIGLLCLVGLYFYTRRHPPRGRQRPGRGGDEPAPRIEPDWSALDSSTPEPYVRQKGDEPPRAPSGEAEVKPAAESLSQSPPVEKIFTLSVKLPDEGVPATEAFGVLKHLGCTPGADGIYHCFNTSRRSLYSVADLFEPGALDPPSAEYLRGLVFFFAAPPGPDTATLFDRMLGAARECAHSLGGSVRDAGHHPLTAARELELKLAATHA
ncbi:MAG: cell division protein ZipA C-terminal FtsZ-binding domain-containing protein [Gammaproteobacteria bacterium]